MTARRTIASDEPAFVRLLHAAYGETYSYRELYAPGGFAALLASGRVMSFGDFDPEGELFSHTAFLLKDPRGDYVESGMSLRNPRLRSTGRTGDEETWEFLFTQVPAGCAYLHQNTTTWHPLAQRYASRYMGARPTGIVADYTIGEQVVGFPTRNTPMQALTMSTALLPELPSGERGVLVPDGPWARWIAERFETWGRRVTPFAAADPAMPLALSSIEDNPAIGLRRRALELGGGDVDEASHDLARALAAERPRTDLLHLPADARIAALPALLAAGYLPVGVRPHATRPDELIVQHLPSTRRPGVVRALREAHVHGDDARRLLDDWISECERTS